MNETVPTELECLAMNKMEKFSFFFSYCQKRATSDGNKKKSSFIARRRSPHDLLSYSQWFVYIPVYQSSQLNRGKTNAYCESRVSRISTRIGPWWENLQAHSPHACTTLYEMKGNISPKSKEKGSLVSFVVKDRGRGPASATIAFGRASSCYIQRRHRLKERKEGKGISKRSWE